MATLNKRSIVQYIQYICGLGILNLLLSLYMSFGNIESGTCDLNTTLSCTSVIKSEYGKILGLPVAYYGISWNIVLLYCVWRIYLEDKIPAYITTIYLWCSVGVGFVIYFIAAEIIIGKICPFCTMVHIINVGLMYLAFKVYNDLKAPPPIWVVANSLKSFIVSVAIGHLLIGSGGLVINGVSNEPSKISETFSQCLSRKNMVMFGSSRCGACINQKKLFLVDGVEERLTPWNNVNFVECSKSKKDANKFNEECENWDIGRYPTWLKFAKEYIPEDDKSKNEILEKHEGVLSIVQLSKMSGCEFIESDSNEKSTII
ncbi:hypothetical protein DICPUDRAFT_149647 [Dictyostelium purpureum]|uniref:Vitamin K epoxide reductase domain-containing protein n=1 Tax=Dictyostelium purpureum TaxID=5786 RepID=F0ZEA9_DICPU|nr:uncharacterized protein DICPUDRAFT_149647 [Dictyostelium purpureum]EGC37723.1 hypothetical protein DICPUDRAFT_149647 [Dictyostelium purpureum]|eukprot:XP_003285744.1 hypothetical protein DICPUDRAFT_149647 [Dictyostelium purpureum]